MILSSSSSKKMKIEDHQMSPIERDFLDQLHVDSSDTKEFSFNEMFQSILRDRSQNVDDQQFTIIQHNLTPILQKEGFIYSVENHNRSKLDHCTWGDITRKIGKRQSDGEILDQQGHLIHRIARFGSFHQYTISCVFTGTWAELICQIPEQYRQSNRHYYFSHEFIEERYGTHYVMISLYEKIDLPELSLS